MKKKKNVKNKFEIVFLDGVLDFLDKLNEKARNKILFNIDKSQKKNDPKLFKKLTVDIWEFRTLHDKKQYRLFAFWDKTNTKVTIVIATHGIIKKTQKTPQKEIVKAVELKRKYFNDKE